MLRISSQSRHEALGMLMMKGFNMRSFALSRGYKPATVRQTINRYVGNEKGKPVGKMTKAILQDLEVTLWGDPDASVNAQSESNDNGTQAQTSAS